MAIASRLGYSVRDRRSSSRVTPIYAMEPLLALLDALAIFMNGMLATYFYHKVVLKEAFTDVASGEYAALSLLAAVLFVTLYKAAGAYQKFLTFPSNIELRQDILIWLFVVVLLSLVAFLLKNGSHFSRGTLIFFAIAGMVTIGLNRLIWRWGMKVLVEKKMLFVTRVLLIRSAVIGIDENGTWATSVIPSDLASGYSLTHQIELNMASLTSSLSAIQSVVTALVLEQSVDEIFVEIQRNKLENIPEILGALRVFPLPVRIILDPHTASLARRPLRNFGSLLLAEVQREPLTWAERFFKRVLDLVVATFALILFTPLFLVVALAIKIESQGPVFFVQDRKGFSGKPFKIIKFRSMNVTENGCDIRQATSGDLRVTRIGRFIRRTSIDELPQLLNVLIGTMSIVGPRPHAVAHDNHYGKLISEYALRHHTKPGLTGLSQVMGLRGETPRVEDMKARVEMDVNYINNWSLWGDVVIIIRTAFVLFGQRKAY